MDLLFDAARSGQLEELRLAFSQADTDVNATEHGQTALSVAARSGNFEVVKFLVEDAGAELDGVDQEGWTALMHSAYFGHLAVARLLSEHGADPFVRNSEGLTVLDLDPISVSREEVAAALSGSVHIQKQKALAAVGAAPADEQNASDNVELPAAAAVVAQATPKKQRPASSGSNAARGRVVEEGRGEFVPTYRLVCQDFAREPEARVVALEESIREQLASGSDELKLDLSAHGLGREEQLVDMSALPLFETLTCLAGMTQFTHIDLSYNDLRESGGKSAGLFLSHCPSVRVLNLEGNHIGPVGAAGIAEAVATHPNIQVLNLSHNPLGGNGTEALGSALQSNQSLVEVNLGFTEANTRAIVRLALAIQSHPTLRSINLDKPNLFSIQDETTIHLSRALRENSVLESISLRQHGIRDEGVMWLMQALASNPHTKLQRLDLSSNRFGSPAMEYIAVYLQRNDCSLQSLSLSTNRLAESAADDLELAVGFNKSLHTLDLSFTSLEDTALAAIARALRVNTTIVDLHLRGNLFGPETQALYRDLIKTKRDLWVNELDFLPLVADGIVRDD